MSFPPSITILVPTSPSLVSKVTLETLAIDGSASPRKPKVFMKNKSSGLYILLVACLLKAFKASLGSIPIPLSITLISLLPAFSSETDISVL